MQSTSAVAEIFIIGIIEGEEETDSLGFFYKKNSSLLFLYFCALDYIFCVFDYLLFSFSRDRVSVILRMRTHREFTVPLPFY